MGNRAITLRRGIHIDQTKDQASGSRAGRLTRDGQGEFRGLATVAKLLKWQAIVPL